jgi:hypothetical protein
MQRTLKNWQIWGLGFASAAILALSLFVFTEPASKINTKNAAKIRPGMTLEQVEEVFGGLPRLEGMTQNYVAGKFRSKNRLFISNWFTREGHSPDNGEHVVRAWYSDETTVFVYFIKEEVGFSYCNPPDQPGFLDRVVSWLPFRFAR